MRAAFCEGHETISLGQCVPVPAARGEAQVSRCGIRGAGRHIFHQMWGVIAAVGEGVAGFAPGGRVTVRPLEPCGDCAALGGGEVRKIPVRCSEQVKQ